jgi:hypothetical protein
MEERHILWINIMLRLIMICRLGTCVWSKIRPACEQVKMAPIAACRLPIPTHARSRDRNGMNGGKVSLFHVVQANVLTLHDVNSSRQDIRESRFSSNLNAFCRLDTA